MLTRQSHTWRRPAARLALFALLSLPLPTVGHAVEFDDRLGSPMFHDPELALPPHRLVFYDNLRPVWFAALSDDDPELRRLAADTIAMAHRRGMRGLEEAEDALVELLRRSDSDSRLRRAAAHALVQLNAKSSAEALFQHISSGDLEYSLSVEPTLAKWNYRPMVQHWLSRLDEPATGRVRLSLAFQCLGIVQEQAALERLTEIALDSSAAATQRLVAARAAADIDRASLSDTAASLLSRTAVLDRLVGTTLLRRHSSEQAVELLQRSAVDQSSVVAGLALRLLFELDPRHVFAHADLGAGNSDTSIRRVAAETLVVRADADAVELLAALLDDPHRDLRRYVSNQLIRLAESDELRPAVIAEASRVAIDGRWRGLEQALYILGALDHEPSADRMVELLQHQRPEVGVAAAWALREIAVAEALPGMLDYARDHAAAALAGRVGHHGLESQLTQLCQAFGKQQYSEADSLLRKFIPKVVSAAETRAAAIWALGLLHRKQALPDLSAQLQERIADVDSPIPEFESVRRMSAVSLARMQATSAVPTLRQYSREGNTEAALGCKWALEQLTDDEFPASGPVNVADSNWFLAPIKLVKPIERVGPRERAARRVK